MGGAAFLKACFVCALNHLIICILSKFPDLVCLARSGPEKFMQ